jgi:hypothetical protein
MPVFTSSIEVTADYPTIKPSLNLNFARARALDPRIRFTRASVGTYVGRDGLIKTAGEDEARFDHDPDTLESLGLLIEESRTNSQTNSQPQSGSFTGGGATVTYNTATAPNGATEACRIARNGTDPSTSNWVATRSITFNANTMVLSCWAKAQNGNNYFVWSFQTLGGAIVRAGFLLTGDGGTQIITNGNGGHTLQIQKYPDGWYRCIIIGNTQSSGATTQFLYTANAYDEGNSAIGGSTLVWGFQLEAGSFPTSYIPTSGSSVTRGADFGSITGESFSNFFNQSEGTFDVGYKLGDDNTSMRVAQVSSANSSTVIDLVVGSGGGAGGYWYILTGGVVQFSAAAVVNSSQVDRNFRAVLAYKENDCAAQSNKITSGPTTDTSATLATDYNKLLFYQNANGGDQIQGHLKYIRYYPKRITNAQVTQLSQDGNV